MINLFEHFNQESKTLYDSMKEAGMDHLTIVLKDDGFLPESITSPYRFFAENTIEQSNRALYFNEVPVPKFWNIEGDNNQAIITDMGQVRGKIYYHSGDQQRIVKYVDWLDLNGNIRFRDHYDQNGIRYAQTTFDLRGGEIFKLYVTEQDKPLIYVNYITGNYVLTWHGKDYFFENEVDFTLFYLDMMHVASDNFVINHLGTPLSVLYHLKHHGHDYVVWQESLNHQNELPSNMCLILNENGENQSLRTFTLIVPAQAEYDIIMRKVRTSAQQQIKQGGYIYPLTRRHQYSNHVLIMTNSDQIAHLETIVKESPHLNFHIGALTEMSSKLMAMERFDHVKLYPSIEQATVEALYQQCDIYLDINSGNEILDAVHRAFMADMLIFAYLEVAHNLKYVKTGVPSTVFETKDYQALIHMLHQTVMDGQQRDALLYAQKQHANMIDKQAFCELFNG